MIQFQNEAVIVYQSALFQTTSTVIQTKEMMILVDPNWLPNEIETIQNDVHAIQGEREIYLLFTHGDFDHIIGYQAFPGAKTIGSLGLHNHPKKDDKLKLIRNFDNENYVIRNYPIVFPELDIVIQEDGQQFQLGETTLTFYLAPGHTADGLMTVVEPLGILIAGDYLSDFELPFIYDSAKAYSNTLDKSNMILKKHNVQLLIPGHGLATSDPSEMKRRVELAADYLKRLRQSVIANDESALEALNQEHAFPSSFTEGCHKENVIIMKREYV